jgi:hypothetical protein
MAAEKPLVYLLLGSPGSGRREVLADLLDGGLDESDQPAVLLPGAEPPVDADLRLGAPERWRWEDGRIEAAVPAGADRVFFVVEGRRNPVDQLEAFKLWLPGQGLELGRVICIVDCAFASAHPQLQPWFDACIHFSDVVLLNHRDLVPNKWLSDFQARYKDQCFPCLFEFVKKGRVHNPRLILEPLALRISHAFDAEPDWVILDEDGEELEADAEDEGGAEGEEEVELVAKEDPYFVRWSSGRREKELPNLEKYL